MILNVVKYVACSFVTRSITKNILGFQLLPLYLPFGVRDKS
jgi:hypothetical protein